MKKNLLFGLACFLSIGTVMANESSSEKQIATNGNEFRIYENPVNPGEKKKKAAASESDRNFHIIKGDDNKVVLMVAKKPNTKVRVKVYDKNGTLVYFDSINAKRDFATVLNLEAVDGAVIQLSDTNGLERNYTL